MSDQNSKKLLFGLKRAEIITFVGAYIILALMYYITLYLNRKGYDNPEDIFLSPIQVLDDAGLDYIFKFLLSLPILYLMFVRLKHLSLRSKIILHFILLPIYVFTWQWLYYYCSELLGFWHLRGAGSVWDVYIPILFYVLQFGVIHSYVYYKENQRKIILEGELRTAAYKSELSALKAQLNPHFLYNVFNTINAAVHPENEKARHMIAELSDLFRYQLKASKSDRVSLRDELEFVQKYLALEKERFEDRLTINLNVDESILNVMIPPMLLQPLVENSIKHGLSSLVEGGSIFISIFPKGDKLYFEIADDGVGVQDKTSLFNKGVGLTNTKLRLEKIYNSTMKITDNQPKGLKISFEI